MTPKNNRPAWAEFIFCLILVLILTSLPQRNLSEPEKKQLEVKLDKLCAEAEARGRQRPVKNKARQKRRANPQP